MTEEILSITLGFCETNRKLASREYMRSMKRERNVTE